MLFIRQEQPTSPTQSVKQQETPAQGHKAESPDPELTGSTWLTKDAAGFFTFGLVIIGVGQALLFFVQLRYMGQGLRDAERAAKAAQDSADATRESVTLAKDTAQRQLRAYIVARATGISVDDILKDKIVVAITITNTGQTPAHQLSIVSRTRVMEYPLKLPFNFTLITGADPSRGVLGADQTIESESSAERPLTGDEMMRVQDSEGGFRVYTYGTDKYRDVFGNAHYTNFCSTVIFDDGVAIAHASEHHNDAS